MYIRSLEIKDLRAFRETKIELLYPGRRNEDDPRIDESRGVRHPNVNILLGVNGSGKSTVLDATALAMLSPLIASAGYRPFALIRRSNRGTIQKATIRAELVLHPQDGVARPRRGERRETLSTTIDRRGDIEFVRNADELGPVWERMYDDQSAAFFFVGYGAMRRVEAQSANDLAVRRKSRLLKYERVASLFEDHFALTAMTWLSEYRSRDPRRFEEIVHLVNRLTPPTIDFAGEEEGGDFLFKHGSIAVPLAALSDGYRAYIGWISDLLYHLCFGAPAGVKLAKSCGVVLVDEIDLHVHPEWQRTIIPTLAKTFPNIQFIFTTHSALVISTLERANIFNVERGRGGIPKISRPTEETFGLSADQILRSDMFGLDSSRAPVFVEQLRVLAQDAQTGKDGAAIQFLRAASLGAGHIADQASSDAPPSWLLNPTSTL